MPRSRIVGQPGGARPSKLARLWACSDPVRFRQPAKWLMRLGKGNTMTMTAPLEARIADRLLDLLSTDDGFRDRFQRDHLSALAEIGYVPQEPGAMTACGLVVSAQPEPFDDCKVTQLAPKQVIASARAELRKMLLTGLNQTVPQLDVGLDSTDFVLK